jgi:hypothetical protein
MTNTWSRLKSPPFLTFEENGQLVKADGKNRFAITINALFRVVNSNLDNDDKFDPDTVAGWLGIDTPLTFRERRRLIDDPSVPPGDKELLVFAIQTMHYPRLVLVAREVLNQMAKRNKAIAHAAEFFNYSETAKNESVRWERRPSRAIYAGRSYLAISELGDLTAVADPVLVLFDGMKDTERISKCAICDKFFWAGRITARCCSPRCTNTLIKRESRSPDLRARAKANRIRREELKARRGAKG